jgi:hypothetical protein
MSLILYIYIYIYIYKKKKKTLHISTEKGVLFDSENKNDKFFFSIN